jgi:WD40 repeat protein
MQSLDNETGAEMSPDGAWILYWSQAHSGSATPGTLRLMRIPASGGSPEKVLEAPAEAALDFNCPSAAGSCVVSHWEQGYVIFYALDPVQGQGKELARTKLDFPSDLVFGVSRDGSRIAISSQDQLAQQIRILDLRGGAERNLPFPHGSFIWSVQWSADGNALFASVSTTRNAIAHIDLDGKTRAVFNRDRNQWLGFSRPSPDGRRLAFTQRTFESNAWLLENF